jgi:hypothetical protein
MCVCGAALPRPATGTVGAAFFWLGRYIMQWKGWRWHHVLTFSLRSLSLLRARTRGAVQISTTKGTGGDVIILEEAAYIDPGFFYVSRLPVSTNTNSSSSRRSPKNLSAVRRRKR